MLTTRLAKWHFAPTESNRQNLLKEGVRAQDIYVTGNTVIDALKVAVKKVEGARTDSRRKVLITGHRRENFGTGFEHICLAVRNLAKRFVDVDFIYPVHMNPNVREPVNRLLSGLDNVKLIEPQPYLPFVRLMNEAYLILTDSGGVQEEAPSLGKSVLVMRDTTERPEAVAAGTVKIIGTERARIESETARLLEDATEYVKMSAAVNPYGDGHAVERIIEVLARHED